MYGLKILHRCEYYGIYKTKILSTCLTWIKKKEYNITALLSLASILPLGEINILQTLWLVFISSTHSRLYLIQVLVFIF